MIGYAEPRVGRATIRILAEAYYRHPEETIDFLKSSGAIVNEEELLEIKMRHDARLGKRQIDEREWGRILHFLLRRLNGRRLLIDSIHILLEESSYFTAVHRIMSGLDHPSKLTIELPLHNRASSPGPITLSIAIQEGELRYGLTSAVEGSVH